MHSKKLKDGYIVRIKKGEEIIGELTRFCSENNIKSGSIAGIGATDNVSLGYFDLDKKEYIEKKFSGKNFEIISMNGNISLVDGKPFAHIHITLGDSDYSVFGGHLNSAVVSVTGEITLTLSDGVLERKPDEHSGLNLLNL